MDSFTRNSTIVCPHLGVRGRVRGWSNTYLLMPLLLFLGSCSLIQPPVNIPSYIRVQSYTVMATPSQGTASANITDVWVDDNTDYRGIYQVPVSVPILKTGPTTISLQAVVQEDGIVSNLLPYPFYTTYTVKNVNLQAGKLDTINPVFYYNPGVTKFAWPEGDFEGTNPLHATSLNTANAFITTVKDSVFEGQKSYEVNLSPGHDTFSVTSPSTPFSPPGSYVVWLEMNYKTDVPMDVGFISLTANSNPSTQEFVSGVNPTSTWKKVYINIGAPLLYYNQNPYFQIYFYATAPGNAHIFIDNLKLLYLE